MKEKRIAVKLKEAFNFLRMLKNPLAYLLDCGGLIKEKFAVYFLKNGLKFKVRAGTCDRGIIKEIFFYKCYNPEGFAIEEGDIVFDIGAQIGIFSIYAGKLAKNGKVFSFEPLPENFQLLEENISLNDCANIRAHNAAIAAADGERELFSSADNTGGHSFLEIRQEGGEKIKVKAFSLAEFLTREKIEKIDFLKMDCEGGEYEIFFNLPLEALKKIKKISMEYHDLDQERNGEKMKNFLEAQGFAVRLITGKFPMIYASRQ